MTKSILRPSIIIALLILLIGGGALYFSYFQRGGEVYVNQNANAASSIAWKDTISRLQANSDSAKLVSAENIGPEPNLTDALTKSLTNTLGPRLLKQGGLKGISQTDIQSAAQYLPQADAILPEAITITAADLKISEKNDAESVKKYFDDVMGVYLKTFFALKEDDVMIIQNALTAQKLEDFSKLSTLVDAFNKSYASVKEIPVPIGQENFAVRELNYMARSKQIIEKMERSQNDVVAILILLPKRLELMAEINKFHKDTGALLKSQGILFSNKEDAYDLLY